MPSTENSSTPGPDLTVGDQIEVTIERPISGGQCLARHEGQVIFVRDAIPGESILVEITAFGRKSAFARADVVEVVAASPHRVEPPCPVVAECGGCDWQHVDLDYQRVIKRDTIMDAMVRIGGFPLDVNASSDSSSPGSDSSPETGVGPTTRVLDTFAVGGLDDNGGLEYRTRMRYSIDPEGVVGLKPARSNRVIPAFDCLLAVPEIRAEVPERVTNFGDAKYLVAAAMNTNQASDDHAADDQVAGDQASDDAALAEPNAETALTESSVEFGSESTERAVKQRVLGREFTVGLNGFWQVHADAPETLVREVLELAQPNPGESAFDLYSGVGLFSAFLAQAVGETGRVYAVEGDRRACVHARTNLADLGNVTQAQSSVAKWLTRPDRVGPDLVVLDPPRAGAGSEVTSALVGLRPKRIVYVSCDAASFARDAKALTEGGYVLQDFRGLDMFPMTKHCETIALFTL